MNNKCLLYEKGPYFTGCFAIFETDWSLSERMVYIYLFSLQSEFKKVFPSYQTIADRCLISRRTAISAIQKLESIGIIEKTTSVDYNGINNSNSYIIQDIFTDEYIVRVSSRMGVNRTEVGDSNIVKSFHYENKKSKKKAISPPKSKKPMSTKKVGGDLRSPNISFNNTNNISINNKEIDNNKIRSTEPAKMKKIKYAKKENSISGNSKNKTSALDQFQKLRQTESKSNTRKETIEKFKKYPSKRFISWKIKEPSKWNKLEMLGFYLSTWLEFSESEDPEFKRNSRFSKESHLLGLFVEKFFDGNKEEFKKYTLWCFDYIFNSGDSDWIQNAGFYKIYSNYNNLFWKTFKTSKNKSSKKNKKDTSWGNVETWRSKYKDLDELKPQMGVRKKT